MTHLVRVPDGVGEVAHAEVLIPAGCGAALVVVGNLLDKRRRDSHDVGVRRLQTRA
jgi:hypothetical protein